MVSIGGIAPSKAGKLIFPHNAFVAIDLALHPILEHLRFFGQKANDLKVRLVGSQLMLFVPVR
jgi:hypothetical protein